MAKKPLQFILLILVFCLSTIVISGQTSLSSFIGKSIGNVSSAVFIPTDSIINPIAMTCKANFTHQQNSINQKEISFINASTGISLNYFWNFGDGNTSTSQNPSHIYTTAGIYNVCFVVTNAFGCADSICKIINLGQSGNCVVTLNYHLDSLTANFSGMSTGPAPHFYLWDFGDGTSSTSPTPRHDYQYTPIPKTFTVCLTMTDANGCTKTYCESIIVPKKLGISVFGNVLLNASPINEDSNKVLLYKQMNSGSSTYFTQEGLRYTDSTGFYYFENLNSGIYFVKAELKKQSAFYADCFPTYHHNKFMWSTATASILNSSQSINIEMVKLSPVSGIGKISGKVIHKDNHLPLQQADVFLVDKNDTPLRFTQTNGKGEFYFEDLPLMDFVVYVDVIGKYCEPLHLSLNHDNTEIENVIFSVNNQQITGLLSIESESTPFLLYPNPSNGQIYISSESYIEEIKIYSISGAVVYQNYKLGNSTLAINLTHLSNGIYNVLIVTDKGIETRKMAIKPNWN
jgi:PKD repeat protein